MIPSKRLHLYFCISIQLEANWYQIICSQVALELSMVLDFVFDCLICVKLTIHQPFSLCAHRRSCVIGQPASCLSGLTNRLSLAGDRTRTLPVHLRYDNQLISQ